MTSGTCRGQTTVTPTYFQNVLIAPRGNHVPVSSRPHPGPLRPARQPRVCSRPAELPALDVSRAQSPVDCPPRPVPFAQRRVTKAPPRGSECRTPLRVWLKDTPLRGRPTLVCPVAVDGTWDISTSRLLRLGLSPVASAQRDRDAFRERDQEGGQLGRWGGRVRQGTEARAAFCKFTANPPPGEHLPVCEAVGSPGS